MSDWTELMRQVMEHEGYEKTVYKCPAGYNTVGYGLNLDAGVSIGLAKHILKYQLNVAGEELAEVVGSWCFSDECDVRWFVLTEMVFNLGITRFKKFKKTIAAYEAGDYDTAADEMLDSKWAKQVGQRAQTLARQMRTGEW